jgi:Mce-associated membrane protein
MTPAADGLAEAERPERDRPEPDHPEPDHPRAPAPPGEDRPSLTAAALVPWVLAAVGLLGTLAFGLAWRAERGAGGATATATAEEGASADLLATARSFAERLTNFDGATIDGDFDELAAMATGEFRSQVDQFFSDKIRSQLKEAQAASRGEVRSAFVQTAEADRGTVFVVVDQTIANNRSPQPRADTLRMELGLVLEDGAWMVERVAVLTAPSGGSTLVSEGAELGD